MTRLVLDACGLPEAPAEFAELMGKVATSLARAEVSLVLVLHLARDRERLLSVLKPRAGFLELREVTPETDAAAIGGRIFDGPAENIGHVVCGKDLGGEMFDDLAPPRDKNSFKFLLPPVRVSTARSIAQGIESVGWMAGREVAGRLTARARTVGQWRLSHFLPELHGEAPAVFWESAALPIEWPFRAPAGDPFLRASSRILAIVPHYHCEEWLAHILKVLTGQTRRPDGIVVVDDCSGAPPREIVAAFPDVTLLSTPRNVGPEALVHQVMAQTEFDGYMIHDADDWASNDRLELSLAAAEQTGAGLVATQELQYLIEESRFVATTFPLNVTAAMRVDIGHYTINGSNLVSRRLARMIGGMDDSFRLSADTDFIYRAGLAHLVVNLPRFCYLRRERPGSLTTAPETKLGTVRRDMELISMAARARRNQQRLRENLAPRLRPVREAAPLAFIHELGPRLPVAICGLTPP
jgi:hypothetical protein